MKREVRCRKDGKKSGQKKIHGVNMKLTTDCLRLISGGHTLVLGPTDGKEIIFETKHLWTYSCSSSEIYESILRNEIRVMAPATPKMNVAVYERFKSGDPKFIFNSLENDLRKLCLTQAQIIQFTRRYRDWLVVNNIPTLFLFNINDEFFMADIAHREYPSGHICYNSVPNASVYRLSRADHIDCFGFFLNNHRQRVVVPENIRS